MQISCLSNRSGSAAVAPMPAHTLPRLGALLLAFLVASLLAAGIGAANAGAAAKLIAPANKTVSNATGKDGNWVTFSLPTQAYWYDIFGNIKYEPLYNKWCSPVSGSYFGLGNTTVTCDGTIGKHDFWGNFYEEDVDASTFTVRVNDTEAPRLAHANIVEATAPGQASRVVSFSPAAA